MDQDDFLQPLIFFAEISIGFLFFNNNDTHQREIFAASFLVVKGQKWPNLVSKAKILKYFLFTLFTLRTGGMARKWGEGEVEFRVIFIEPVPLIDNTKLITLKVLIFAREIFANTYFREFREFEKKSRISRKFVFPKFSKTT